MRTSKLIVLTIIALLGVAGNLNAQTPHKWPDLLPLENFNGDYETFIKQNFGNSGKYSNVKMGLLMDDIHKSTHPTYFAIDLFTDIKNKNMIWKIALFYQPMEWIKQHTLEKQIFNMVAIELRTIYVENPKFRELQEIGLDTFIAWDYDKYYDVFKNLDMESIGYEYGHIPAKKYLKNPVIE